MRIRLPNNWRPRPYQLPAWTYLENGGRHCELHWHRRSGKDEIALHRTACAAFERVAGYWHMLPEYAQARKAIWDAVNPHTGKRRIDEAFPLELRQTTREHDMQIVFKNGSNWQVVGSDNFNKLVGSTPAGVVYSEWALANPSARAYIRPILAENRGWQMFITTPRGRNHAFQTFEAARKDPQAFAQRLTATDTGVFTAEQLAAERSAYIAEFGQDMGESLYEQEYLCSYDAAIFGAYYGSQIRDAEKAGRIAHVDHDPALKTFTAWDLGYTDDTAIWWFQVTRGEIHVIDHYAASGLAFDDYAQAVIEKPYKYAMHYLPHDARAKTLASGGRSIQEMAWKAFGSGFVRIVPELSVQDGIQAARAMLPHTWFDESRCAEGIEALRQYQREWDDEKKAFRERPRHDWTSHTADAFRMMAVAWREEMAPAEKQPPKFRNPQDMTLNELWKTARPQPTRI